MPTQNLQRIKVCLPHVRWPVEVSEPGVGWRVVAPHQQLFISKKLTDTERHHLDEQVQWAVLHIRKFDLLIY